MKLSKDASLAYFRKPDPDATGILIYGPDPMRIALRRQELVAALIGPDGEKEMRLTRIPAGDLRREEALLDDAIKTIGFFQGVHVALVEDATDQVAGIITDALDRWQTGDAQIIVTSGALKPTSKIRKAFEAHKKAFAAAIYPDPPGRAEIEQAFQKAGVPIPGGSAMSMLMDLARALEPGDFAQTLEKIALYKLNDPDPVSAEDVAACMPMSIDADVDDILMIVGDGAPQQIGPVMQRLRAQGINPTTLCIGAMRHFRTLHRLAADPQGRHPIWGPNRDRIANQARAWGVVKLETALTLLTDTDLTLRSQGASAPAMALVERAFIRLAMLARR